MVHFHMTYNCLTPRCQVLYWAIFLTNPFLNFVIFDITELSWNLLTFHLLALKTKLSVILPKWVYLGTAECNSGQASFGKTTSTSGEQRKGSSFIEERGRAGQLLYAGSPLKETGSPMCCRCLLAEL